MVTGEDIPHIKVAIERAKLAQQEPGPIRPKVGAVLVREGRELGKAHRSEIHLGDHAEYTLLELKLGHEDVIGGTLYTTLEPCTVRSASKVPCADRIIDRKLRRVVIGMLDPNQRICGRGIRHLQSRGIEVDLFPAEFVNQVEDQNRDFVRFQNQESERSNQELKLDVKGVLNPRFDDDSARLDSVPFRSQNVVSEETIFIIAGDTIVSELLDRYACTLLREQIARAGQGDPFKRALIVSAATWKGEDWLTRKCPGISVGSDGCNDVSRSWLAAATHKGVHPFPLSKGHGVYLSDPRPRVVLYGLLAADTRSAVERYMTEPRGLKDFLTKAWS